MAITKQQLEYTIKVNAKESSREVKNLTQETERLRDAAGKFATQEQVALYNSLQQTRKELDAQAAAGKNVEKEYKKLDAQIKAVGIDTTKSADGADEMSSSLGKISSASSGAVQTIANLSDILDKFSDPEKVKRTASLLIIISKLASVKGFDNVSNGLVSAASALDNYSAELERNGSIIDQYTQKIDSLGNTFRSIDKAFNFAVSAFETVAIAGAGTIGVLSVINSGAIPKTERAFSDMAKSVKPASESVGRLSVAVAEFAKYSSGISVDTLSSGLKITSGSATVASSSIKTFVDTVSRSASIISTSWQMARAAELSFFEAISNTSPVVMAQLKVLSSAFLDIFKRVFSFFKNSGITNLFKDLSSDIQTAFNVSGIKGSTDSFSATISSVAKPVKDLSKSFVDIAKEIPNSWAKVTSGLSTIPKVTKDFFDFSATVLKSHVGPAFFTAAEAASALKGGLVGLGAALLGSDSTFVKLSGTLMLVAGIMLGGFAYAVKILLGYIGSLVTAIGDTLIGAMDAFEKKFQKAEVAATNFVFTIRGMNREFGESSGTIESWSAIVEQLAESTLIARADAQKMAIEIMSVGHGLGLTRNQMEDLIKLIPNYVKAGDDAFDVTVSFLQALGGAPQGVLKYAVHLSEASVEHSKFAKTLGIAMGQLSEEEKVQARFNALMEQSAPILGRSANSLDTVAGSQQYLAKNLDQVQALMGQQNFLVAALNVGLAKLATTATKLPAPFWTFLGAMQDVLGVSTKIIGTFISWAFPVAALVSLYKILSVVVVSNTTAQILLSKALTFANVSLGGQALAVTSLSTLWGSLAVILRSIVITTMASLIEMFAALARGIWGVTAAILSNPLFLKAAAIVAGITLLYKAMQRIEEETKILSEAIGQLVMPFNNMVSSISSSTNASNYFSKIISTVLRSSINIAVVAVGSLIATLYSLAAAVAYTLNTLTFGKFKVFADEVNAANEKILKLNSVIGKAASEILSFSSVASAETLDSFGKGADEAKSKLEGLKKELVSATEKALIWAQAAGKEGKAMLLSKQLIEERTAIAKDIEEKKGLAKDLEQINAQIAVFPQKTIDEAKKSIAQLRIDSLNGLNEIAATRKAGAIKIQEALAPMREKLADIELLPKTADTQKAANELRTLMAETQKNINDETLSKIQSLKDARLQNEIDTRLEIAKMRNDDLAQIKINAEKQIAAITASGKAKSLTKMQQEEMTSLILAAKDKQILELAQKEKKALVDANATYAQLIGDQSVIAQTEYEKQLTSYQEMLDKKLLSTKQFEAAREKLEQQKALGEAKGAGAAAANLGQQGITQAIDQVGSFMGGFSSMLMGPVAAVQGVVSIAQAIVDIIPNLLSSLTNLVTSFVELPTKILDGVVALAKAIPRIISEFIPRLLEAVPEIIFSILDMLYTAIPDAFLTLFNKIPLVIEAITDKLPEMAQSLVKGFITALPKIALGFINYVVNGIPKMIRAIIKAIPEIIDGIIQGLIEGIYMIGDMFASIFSGGDFFSSFETGIVDSVGSALKSVTGAASSLFSVSDIGAPFKDQADNLGKQIKDATRTATGWLAKAWEGMKEAGRWLDQNIWQPIWEKLSQFGTWLWGGIKSSFDYAVNILDALFIEPLKLVGDLFVTAWNYAKGIFSSIIDLFKSTFEGAWLMLKGIFTFDFDLIKAGFEKSFAGIKTFFLSIGDVIVSSIKNGIDAIVSRVGNVLSKLFTFEGGGKGVVEKFIGMDFPFVAFAEGGLVPGKSSVPGDSLKNDTVPALLSPGEVVLPRSVLGDEAFRRVVMAKLAGQEIPQFSLGGSVMGGVKAVGSAVSSVGGSVVDALSQVSGFLIPEWIRELYKSISKFVSGVSLAKLVIDPKGTLMNALSGAVNAFNPYFMQMIKPQGFASGGLVGASTDTVPAMLTPGEFVINRDAARSLGLPMLNTLNTGKISQGGGGSNVQNVEIKLTINTTQGVDAATVKSRVLPVILDELRRASLDGRRVISPAGVR